MAISIFFADFLWFSKRLIILIDCGLSVAETVILSLRAIDVVAGYGRVISAPFGIEERLKLLACSSGRAKTIDIIKTRMINKPLDGSNFFSGYSDSLIRW